MVPTGEEVTVRMREREREKAKTLDDCDTTGPSGTLTVNRSGRAVLKERADVAVGKLKRKGKKHSEREKEDAGSTAFGRKGTAMHH
jgi:hypothetical protein